MIIMIIMIGLPQGGVRRAERRARGAVAITTVDTIYIYYV